MNLKRCGLVCGPSLQELRPHVALASCGQWDGVLHPGAVGNRKMMKTAEPAHFWTQVGLPGISLLLCVTAAGDHVLGLMLPHRHT